MALIRKIGVDGANGYAVEFAGEAIAALDMAGRMTICNMALELGARAALIAPDHTVVSYLEGRPQAPDGEMKRRAHKEWMLLRGDADAMFDQDLRFRADEVAPLVSWGTSPDQAIPVTAPIPAPTEATDPNKRAAVEEALRYMGLRSGQPIKGVAISRAFIGSCTNSRIEDLRSAAQVVRGRRVAPGVKAVVVPGSRLVRAAAEGEGLDRIFREAGFEWRGESGCSMCLAMNDDVAAPEERVASSTNRNIEGRQGVGARTHLMSPAMVAAAAIEGRIADVRDYSDDLRSIGGSA
jgi:3-isopropylmalate/(R)-2-methylmalate dehydratase large subunit